MLNLRQLNEPERSTANSDAQHFSRFSALNFRVPSHSLGNIGEPLDYGQAERYVRGDDDDANIVLQQHDLEGNMHDIAREVVLEGPRGADSVLVDTAAAVVKRQVRSRDG